MNTLKKNSFISDLRLAYANNSRLGLPQKMAQELFLSKGLPKHSDEEYKFFPIAQYLDRVDINLGLKNNSSTTYQLPENLSANVITFINGIFSKDHSSIFEDEIQIKFDTSPYPSEDNDPFDILNLSLAQEVVSISISEGKKIKKPLLINYINNHDSTSFYNPRWNCHLCKNSDLCILESGNDQPAHFFINKKTNITVDEGAKLEYVVLQSGSQNSISVNNSITNISKLAQVDIFTFTFDGQLVRNNTTLNIDGEGVNANLHGLYLISNKTIADNHTVVDHRHPNSNSYELYHGVMDEKSVGIFNGKIFVRQHSQKTNAFQSNRNILLSDSATIHAKPQLEIWANDVKCSHGCTTGEIDKDALFYLRSRGISKESARSLILFAFSNQVLSKLKNIDIKNYIEKLVQEKFNRV